MGIGPEGAFGRGSSAGGGPGKAERADAEPRGRRRNVIRLSFRQARRAMDAGVPCIRICVGYGMDQAATVPMPRQGSVFDQKFGAKGERGPAAKRATGPF